MKECSESDRAGVAWISLPRSAHVSSNSRRGRSALVCVDDRCDSDGEDSVVSFKRLAGEEGNTGRS